MPMPRKSEPDQGAPAYANATADDTIQTPSTELVPGTLPQRPMKDRAPSNAQAEQDPERKDAASIPEPGAPPTSSKSQ